MKFIALNSALTAGPGSIAAHVDSPVDSEVFSRMKTLAATRGVPVWLETTVNGLVTIDHSDRHDGVVTHDILQQLEKLYDEAGQLVAAETKALQDKKAGLVQRASESSGLPVDTVAV
ncbi:hypothetical protein A3K87_09915 [Variovorax paradoxus]|uniref:Uncharacterized protein n=1 Tax=Variovorax paradoxus TaxID=34073 RepID=A0AA91ICF7_VARPD|nr:hypothetical protein [Variovorax paradoxus]OAK66071.1 hypothetical protein A3K87_09915 [Variovorax paradoxus]